MEIKNCLKFIALIAISCILSFLDNPVLHFVVFALSMLAVLLNGKFLKYMQSFFMLYLFSILIAFLNYYYNKTTGLENGIIIAFRLINISTLCYIYKLCTSYYDIFYMFSSLDFFPLTLFALSIILVFMFIRNITQNTKAFKDNFLLRFGSVFRHPVIFIKSLSLYLIKFTFLFADSTSLSLETRFAM